MIEIENLRKKYPKNWALRGIFLQIAAGRVTGILGENGSGKSTLFKIPPASSAPAPAAC